MLTVLIICNAGMYIWTLSFLDCCSSLSFSCTYLLNLPWSENTPSKHDLGVACRGLEGCFRVLNGGTHGLSSPLRWRQWWISKNNCTSCKNIDVSRIFALNITIGSVYHKVTKCSLSKGRMQFEEKDVSFYFVSDVTDGSLLLRLLWSVLVFQGAWTCCLNFQIHVVIKSERPLLK